MLQLALMTSLVFKSKFSIFLTLLFLVDLGLTIAILLRVIRGQSSIVSSGDDPIIAGIVVVLCILIGVQLRQSLRSAIVSRRLQILRVMRALLSAVAVLTLPDLLNEKSTSTVGGGIAIVMLFVLWLLAEFVIWLLIKIGKNLPFYRYIHRQ